MHKRVGNGVIDGFIHLSIAAVCNQLCLLIQLFGHIAHNAGHFLERAVQRHHADAHNNILQFVGQLAQLTDGLCEVIQTQAVQIGVTRNHRLGSYNFAHQIHQAHSA